MNGLRQFFDSLAGRTLLLVLAVVAVAEIATFSLFFQQGRKSHGHQTARNVAGQVRLLQSLLPGLDVRARQRLEAAAPGEQWLQLRPDGTEVPPDTPAFGFAQGLGERVGQILGEPIQLRQAGQARGNLWIGFSAGGERWWLILPPPRFRPRGMPPDLWLKLGVALFALSLIAGLFVRGIVGPLRRLDAAVTAAGDGRAHTVIPQGPREVRHLAEHHNAMQAQLTQAEAEQREMLAGLTHDLRAPLARMRVRAALLEGDGERAGLERDIEDMDRIVGQCLSFLRSAPPRNGNENTEASAEKNCAPLVLADAVSDEVARQRELGRPVTMKVDAAAVSCAVVIDHGSLHRLLDNLIDNALQYGEPPVEVTLTAEAADTAERRKGKAMPAAETVEAAETVTLCISDHGRGILPEQRRRAFEAFAQIDPARATRGSCGLGLAIVRRIVEGCGGQISLDEAASGGLAVIMRFPARPPEA